MIAQLRQKITATRSVFYLFISFEINEIYFIFRQVRFHDAAACRLKKQLLKAGKAEGMTTPANAAQFFEVLCSGGCLLPSKSL